MPVLIAIALYSVRIARLPIDVRLKKRHVGQLSVLTAAVVLYLAWDWLRPSGIGGVYFVGEFAGVLAAYLMTCTLILATRIRWLEQWFGGLDQMYLRHKQYAVLSVLLLSPHLLLHFFASFNNASAGWSAHLDGMGHVLGAVSAIGLLALVLVSLGRVARIIRLPYHRWLFVHRLIGLLLLTALVHGWMLDRIIGGSTVLLVIYAVMSSVGLAAYAYDEFGRRLREPRADYTVRRVQRPTRDMIEITLAPADPAPLPVAGGQFVYVRVGNAHEHPFSVAGVDPDGSVRLTIRALGRDTRKLHAEVREGVPATLRGPYGMFDHTLGGARQIWVAGGIGIAPFLGWLAGPGDHPARVDLFYSTPSREEAPFLGELTALAARQPGLHLHPTFSRDRGRLTAERIRAQAGPLHPDTDVFLCGPARMVDDLARGLHREGIARHHLHAEHFTFR